MSDTIKTLDSRTFAPTYAIEGLDLPEWMADGVCAQTDPELFYPEKGGATSGAKALCSTCPVIAECLAYALEHEERFGIWGGKSERERRKIRRAALEQAAASDAEGSAR